MTYHINDKIWIYINFILLKYLVVSEFLANGWREWTPLHKNGIFCKQFMIICLKSRILILLPSWLRWFKRVIITHGQNCDLIWFFLDVRAARNFISLELWSHEPFAKWVYDPHPLLPVWMKRILLPLKRPLLWFSSCTRPMAVLLVYTGSKITPVFAATLSIKSKKKTFTIFN